MQAFEPVLPQHFRVSLVLQREEFRQGPAIRQIAPSCSQHSACAWFICPRQNLLQQMRVNAVFCWFWTACICGHREGMQLGFAEGIATPHSSQRCGLICVFRSRVVFGQRVCTCLKAISAGVRIVQKPEYLVATMKHVHPIHFLGAVLSTATFQAVWPRTLKHFCMRAILWNWSVRQSGGSCVNRALTSNLSELVKQHRSSAMHSRRR